jgi:hypothetical protein
MTYNVNSTVRATHLATAVKGIGSEGSFIEIVTVRN